MFIARKILRKKKVANLICTTSVTFSEALKFPRNKFKDTEFKTSYFARKINVLYFSSQKGDAQKPKNEKKRVRKNSLNIFNSAFVKSVKRVADELVADVEERQNVTEEILKQINNFEIQDSSKNANLYKNNNYKEKSSYSENLDEKVDVKPLDIFDETIMQETESQVKLKIWDDLEAENLAHLIKIPPKNWFEEMIIMTNEGKLWQFPIDNDQGMEKEAEISFTEHIFMEQYLDPWCPKKGPLRRFMELVLIGLAKNHYFTVEEKKAHIDWFRNYFEEKKKLLQELGAMGSGKEHKKIGLSIPREDASC